MESQHQTQQPGQSAEPKLCANNCGFFGNPATEGMCSKCWRDAQTQQKLSVPAAPTLSDAVTSVPVMAPVIAVEAPMESVTTVHEPVKVEADPVPSASDEHAVCTAEGAEGATPARPVQASRNRCFGCNKKVGLLGFECRCGYVFCSSHRHAADHDCSFDFRSMDRQRLAAQNPQVSASKLQKL